LRFGEALHFSPDVTEVLTLVNFSSPEEDFVWSSGRWAEVIFDMDHREDVRPETAICLHLDIDVFKFPPALPGQNVLIYFNGVRVKSAFVTERTVLRFPLGVAPLLPQQNVLTFDLPDARKPQDLGVPDDRTLGSQIFSLALEAMA
jgi:hypothetical protein